MVNGAVEVFAYDDGDKLFSASVGGSPVMTCGYDLAGRSASVISPSGKTTIAYDLEGRATSTVGPGVNQTNVYNGLDTRVGSTTNSVARAFLRDGAYVTDPVLKDGAAVSTPGVSERRGSSTTFSHRGLKNADAQSSALGALTATRQYDAFGNVASSTGTWSGPFGYAGGFGYQEDATGLKLLGHRLYDASTGRFLTRDPIRDGRNWYVYCENDPVSGVDPAGLAKIYVGSRPVAGVGNHVYIIVVDENTGATWTIGGGPTEGGLANHSGPAGTSNYEGLRPGRLPDGAVLILDDDLAGQGWFDRLNGIAAQVGSAGHNYYLFITNSNAFLYTVLVNSGLIDGWTSSGQSGSISSSALASAPGGAIWAPGWGIVLRKPRPRLPNHHGYGPGDWQPYNRPTPKSISGPIFD